MQNKTIHPFEDNNPVNLNKIRVLREIWLKDGISRIEISKKLNLDKSTITKITNQLLDMNFIKTTTIGKTGPLGGRKPISLSINRNKGSFLGIEIQTSKCSALLLDLHGDIIEEYSEIYRSGSIESVLESIKKIIGTLPDNIPLFAAGFGISGIVNHRTGTVIKSYPLNINSPLNLHNMLAPLLPCPVIIDNDANCGCWGELVSSKHQRHDNMLYLSGELERQKRIDNSETGIGIGLGILINGIVHHGTGFSAGEFRSVFLKDSTRNQFSQKETAPILEELAENIAMIINTFNITELVLGGNFYSFGSDLINKFKEKTNKNWAYEGDADCIFRFSKFRNQDVAYGAAAMCLEQYFSA